MATAVIDAEIRLKTANMLEELRKLPGVTEQQARKMTASFSREYAKQTREAEKAAKASAKAFEQGANAIKGSAEKLSSIIGGPFGDMADLALDLGEKLGGTAGAIGAAGAAAGVAVAAVAALGVGVKALADGALEATKRLEEAGHAAEIPPEALESVRDYETSTKDLRTQIDLLTVSIGAPLAGALTTAVDVSAALIAQWRELSAQAKQVQDFSIGMVRGLVAFGSLGTSEIALAYTDAIRESADAARDAAEAYAADVDMLAQLGMTTGDAEADAAALANRTREAAQAERDRTAAAEAAEKAAREKAQAIEEEAEALRDLQERMAEHNRTQAAAITASDNMTEAIRRNQEAWDATSDAVENPPDIAGFWEKATDKVEDYAGKLNELANGPEVNAIMGSFENLAELQSMTHEEDVARLKARMDGRRKEIESFVESEFDRVDALRESGALTASEAALRKREIQEEAQAKRQALRQRTADEREAALKTFRAGQTSARALAIISAAQAALAMIPAFLWKGPFAPIGAAAAAGTALAVQLKTINAQKPPEFAMGRLPMSSDHTTLAALQPAEAVLSQRGVAAAGGREGVAALNDGRSTPNSRIVLQFDRRTIAEVMVESGAMATIDPRRGKYDPWRG